MIEGAQEGDSSIELTKEDLKKLRDITIAAFKHDLANKNDEGFKKVLEAMNKYLPEGTVFSEEGKQKLLPEYTKCRDDYRDTHILGVGKGVGGKIKTAGAMAMRFLKAAFASVGVVIGVPIMAVSALGAVIDGGDRKSLSGMLMEVGMGFVGTGGRAVGEVYQKNTPAKRMVDKVRSR